MRPSKWLVFIRPFLAGFDRPLTLLHFPSRGFEHSKSANARLLGACFKISRRPAARDFGRGQGGEFRASPQRAVRSEPTPATGKRPAARRVFGQKPVLLRCSSVTDRWRVCSLVAPRHPAFCPTTGPLLILK